MCYLCCTMKTKLKLVTVCWVTTVRIELPDNVNLDELNACDGPNADLASDIIKDASGQINWKDGEVTDVIDEEMEMEN